jgi:hypothetical protein
VRLLSSTFAGVKFLIQRSIRIGGLMAITSSLNSMVSSQQKLLMVFRVVAYVSLIVSSKLIVNQIKLIVILQVSGKELPRNY